MTTTAVEKKTLSNFINGQWVKSTTDKYEEVPNPATGEILAEVPISTQEDLDNAVKAAKKAFATWKKVAVPQRSRILFKYQQLLIENWDELAKLITIENGKNYNEAYGEVLRGIECVEFAAGAPTLMMGSQLPDIATNVESGMYRYPLGVVGGITPFNFPMMVPCWMFPLGDCEWKYIHLETIRADATFGKSSWRSCCMKRDFRKAYSISSMVHMISSTVS